MPTLAATEAAKAAIPATISFMKKSKWSGCIMLVTVLRLKDCAFDDVFRLRTACQERRTNDDAGKDNERKN